MKDKTMYLADAIFGHDQEEVKDRFHRLEQLATKLGYEPINPLSIEPDNHDGDCPAGRGGQYGHTDTCNLRADMKEMLDCQAILLGSLWQQSWGARSELYIASVCGLDVFNADQVERMLSLDIRTPL